MAFNDRGQWNWAGAVVGALVTWALLTYLSGCANAPIPQTQSLGWHKCPGRPTGCSFSEVCHTDHCDFYGDQNDPGGGEGNSTIHYPVDR